jgi:drug/metabolite transporter (DMT)-like permease
MFLPIALLAYTLNAGSTIIDKVLLKTGLPNPIVYAFFINILGLLGLILIPFGVQLNLQTVSLSAISGLTSFAAILFYFKSLKMGEASVVVPIVGSLNPLFSLLIGSFLFHQMLTNIQLLAFFVIIAGSVVLTYSLWASKLKLNKQFIDMTVAGLLFAISYLTLKEVFDSSNFITGLALSRAAAGLFALTLLLFPNILTEIMTSGASNSKTIKNTPLLFIIGQTLGAVNGLLLTMATYFANPALVNSLFGAQYLVILIVAIFFASQHRGKLLDEDLSRDVIIQKIIGAIILSIGVYLLSL